MEQLPIPEDNSGFLYMNHYNESPNQWFPDKIIQRFALYYRFRSSNEDGNWSGWTYNREIITQVDN